MSFLLKSHWAYANFCGHITNPIFQGIFFLLHSICVISKDSNLSGFRLERNIVNLELMYFIRFLFNAKIIPEIIY